VATDWQARRGDENWLYIDVGVFNGSWKVSGNQVCYIVEQKMTGEMDYSGPVATAFDALTWVLLPEPEIGNRILIHSQGAVYCFLCI